MSMMIFVVFSSWFILVTSDLVLSTVSSDVTTSPPHTATSATVEITSAASEPHSNSTDFPNGAAFTKEHTLAGKPESRNETNQSLSASLNNSMSCACSPNKQTGNTSVDGAAKLLGCPCVEPDSPDNKSYVSNVSDATKTTLPGPHSPPHTLHVVMLGKLGKTRLFPWLMFVLNLESGDLMDQGYNFLKANKDADNYDVEQEEASLIRLLDGEKLSSYPSFYPYDIHKDFDRFYRKKKFRNKGVKKPFLNKYFHPKLGTAYLKALKSHKSSTPHRVFHKKLRTPFTYNPPGVTLGVLPYHLRGKTQSISQIINRMKQVSGDTCRLKLLDHTIAVPGCAVKSVKVTTCNGSCRSSTYPEWVRSHIEHHESDTCCGNAGIETRWHRLTCLKKPSGRLYVRIDNPVKCICRHVTTSLGPLSKSLTTINSRRYGNDYIYFNKISD